MPTVDELKALHHAISNQYNERQEIEIKKYKDETAQILDILIRKHRRVVKKIRNILQDMFPSVEIKIDLFCNIIFVLTYEQLIQLCFVYLVPNEIINHHIHIEGCRIYHWDTDNIPSNINTFRKTLRIKEHGKLNLLLKKSEKIYTITRHIDAYRPSYSVINYT